MADSSKFRDTANEETRQGLANCALLTLKSVETILNGSGFGYGLGSDDLASVGLAMKKIRETVSKAQFVLVNETQCRAIQANCDQDFKAFLRRTVSEVRHG